MAAGAKKSGGGGISGAQAALANQTWRRCWRGMPQQRQHGGALSSIKKRQRTAAAESSKNGGVKLWRHQRNGGGGERRSGGSAIMALQRSGVGMVHGGVSSVWLRNATNG